MPPEENMFKVGSAGLPAPSQVARKALVCLFVVVIASALLLNSKREMFPATPKGNTPFAPHGSVEVAQKRLPPYGLRTMNAMPLAFEANRGGDGASRYFARGNGYALGLTAAEADFFFYRAGETKRASARSPAPNLLMSSTRVRWHLSELRMQFLGANRAPVLEGNGKLPEKINYFVGNNPRQWRTDVSAYSKVRYHELYPAVDLVFHGRQGKLEYDFTIRPGGLPDRIAFALQGARETEIDAAGDLVAHLEGGNLVLHKPRAYQQYNGIEYEIAAHFRIDGAGAVKFDLGAYDRSRALVIDPVLTYSTYLGGSGTDQARAITVDSSGNVYVTGTTLSADFPTTNGALQTSLAGSTDIFVAKFDPTGRTILYTTFLGGQSDDIPSHIAVDESGNAYVTGLTQSSDFPVTGGVFQSSIKGSGDAFVTKLNPTGSALAYSTYFGGSANDYANSLAVEASGDVYLTGVTYSSDFPISSGAFQTTYPGNGVANAFVAKLLSDGTGLVFSTFLGGSAGAEGAGIAIDPAGSAYVTGFTSSSDFPTATPLQASKGSGNDAFVTKLSTDGTGLVYSTFLGGGGDDRGADIAVDISGNSYVTGQTTSSDFPVANAYQASPGGATDGFVAEINATDSALTYSTYLGGNGNDFPQAITLDTAGDAFVTGQTFSPNFPTASAIQTVMFGGADAFVTELNPTGSALNFSTYLGGSGTEEGTGVAVDSAKNIDVGGYTSSSNFPTLSAALQPSSGGGTDAFVVQIGPASAPAVSLSKTNLSFGDQSLTTTSSAQQVLLRNLGSAPLAISGITVTGDFAQTNNCFSSVPGGSGCELSVSFSPTARGSRTGEITLTDTAADSPQTISLTGNGIVTGVNLSTQSLTFQDQDIGTTSAPQTVTLTNTGQDPFTLNGIAVTGDFSQTNDCGASLAGGASCTFSVTFLPTQALSRTGTVDIFDNAPGSPQKVQLTGTGVGPGVTLSPQSLAFTEQPIGTTSGAQTLTLTNSGNATLSIGSITITGPYSQTNDCASTLDAGKNCTLNVKFKPATAGTSFGAITISDNAPGSPHTVALSGDSISDSAPEVYLAPPSASFGLQPVTTSSAPKLLTLTNTGNAALSIKGIAVTGDYAETNTCGSSLAVGANCTVSVVFTPTAQGPANSSLTITDNASDSPQSFPLLGGGDDFAFSSSATNKTVNAGNSATYTLNVEPVFGFNQQVALTCSGAPQEATCTVQPAMVALDGTNPAAVTVAVTTTTRSILGPNLGSPPGASPWFLYGVSVKWLLVMLALGAIMAEAGRRLKTPRKWLLLTLLLPLLLWSSCNVGSKINGTPPGNFTLTITGTTKANGSTLTHSGNLGLTVN